MATQKSVAEISATGKDLLTVSSNSELEERLSIKPPQDARTTPSVLSIERKREIEIPWQDILGSDTTSGDTSISAIQNYFEHSWGYENAGEQIDQIINGKNSKIKAITASDTADTEAVLEVFRTNPADTEKPVKITAGIIICHGSSGRWYLVISITEDEITLDNFKTPETYQDTWKNKVDGVELVFLTELEAKEHFTEFSEIDLRPITIKRVFNELLLEKKFADDVYENVDAATTKSIEEIVASGMDVDRLEKLYETSFRLKLQQAEVDRRLGRLKSQAMDLGYYLFLTNQDFDFPDGKKLKVKAGQIYRQFKREASWTTSATRRIKQTRHFLFIKYHTTVKQRYSVPHSQVVADYSQVDTNRDPVVDKVTELRKLGMEIFIFENSPQGFISTDGTLLRSVMQQCDRNEAFRRKCAIMLPVFEESMTGQRALVKYSVFLQPLPGISPTILPRLMLRESLSYRTVWKESQLGELVNTINLAPGEDRTVVVTKTFDKETTVTKSSTSIFDVSRTDTTDLASEMENQARSESERSSNMQFSSKVSGGWGPVSAEATASGGTNTSLKDFSQAISKVAKKASQSINQQSREEVTSTSTATVKVTNSDQMTANIRNINQGRTLNLLFYRLNNKFEGGIYIDELQFEVIPSVEIIADSGVHEAMSYGLGQLAELINEFNMARLPFDIDTEDADYLNHVLNTIESLLLEEYGLVEGDSPDNVDTSMDDSMSLLSSALMATKSVNVWWMPAVEVKQSKSLKAGPRSSASKAWKERLKSLADALQKGTLEQHKPIQQDDLILPSGGLYLDTVVGAMPSTEPFSEKMREQEVQQKSAEVHKTIAEAEYQLALATQITRSGKQNNSNWFTGILPDVESNNLLISLKLPLAKGKWDLLVDGEVKAQLNSKMAGKFHISHAWSDPQEWLKESDLLNKIQLLEATSGDSISTY